jgi:hypothetical protein
LSILGALKGRKKKERENLELILIEIEKGIGRR